MPNWTFVPLDYVKFGEGTETFVTSETVFDAKSLGKTTTSTGNKRQDYFLSQLESIAWHLGSSDIPVFISFNGEKRRMDKGCVGHALAAGRIAAPQDGADGYVVTVTLLKGLRSIDGPKHSTLSEFKENYRAYVLNRYKQFDFTPQAGGDKGYYFKANDFPTNMRFYHSFTRSTVILACEARWKDVAARTLTDIPKTMWIENHEKTLSLAIKTAPIDLSASVDSQTAIIDAAIEAATSLLPFAKQVQEAAPSV